MARQDVCTIKSSVLTYLPASLSEVYSSLVSADAFPSVSRSTRSVLRLVVDKERKTVCARHTRGGVVASLIGSIVHEICHLFKIPHTRYGIMKTGGDDVQTFFLADKLINLTWDATLSFHPSLGRNSLETINQVKVNEKIKKSIFDPLSRLLLRSSYFISHEKSAEIHPILYDHCSLTVRSASGILCVVYVSLDFWLSAKDRRWRKKLCLKKVAFRIVKCQWVRMNYVLDRTYPSLSAFSGLL
ncbi:hypothetical protein AB6A40_002478 [Gnathostoma spinigerum]|uniref:Uncharacterized protein n=1 Tax=Gnathostoma spinigerum TaxID=75299 RepID=A0ABD6EEI4_9BILA